MLWAGNWILKPVVLCDCSYIYLKYACVCVYTLIPLLYICYVYMTVQERLAHMIYGFVNIFLEQITLQYMLSMCFRLKEPQSLCVCMYVCVCVYVRVCCEC
jgi:hypothetical protein